MPQQWRKLQKSWIVVVSLLILAGVLTRQFGLVPWSNSGDGHSSAEHVAEILSSTSGRKKSHSDDTDTHIEEVDEESYQKEVARLDQVVHNLTPLKRFRHIQTLKHAPCHHVPASNLSSSTFSSKTTTTFSSLEFIGCCGLGHRLARMANAAHLSAALRAPLFAWWGCCDTTRVFEHLFGAGPLVVTTTNSKTNITSKTSFETNHSTLFPRRPAHAAHFQFRFDVLGPLFGLVGRPKHGVSCHVRRQKWATDYQMYAQLRQRYRQRDQVNAFVQQHLSGRLAIGIHIRAGNHEQGDFVRKRRNIAMGPAEFAARLVTQLDVLIHLQLAKPTTTTKRKKPVVVFVATDTVEYIHELRQALHRSRNSTTQKVDVVDLPQPTRARAGQGVLFGEMKGLVTSGESCLAGWDSVVSDALILSHVDVLLAPRPSALTQTLPLSLVLGGNDARSNNHGRKFCETNPAVTQLKCFDTLQDWACNSLDPKPMMYDVLEAYAPFLDKEEEEA